MFAFDSNVLVRLLIDDPADPRQCVAATELVTFDKPLSRVACARLLSLKGTV